MESNQMKTEISMLLRTAAVLMCLLVTNKAVGAQTPEYDLARDWSLTGTLFKGMPFGPDYAWSVCAVQFQPGEKWETFDRAMHFTVSNPWLDLYGIDGWWLGSSAVARKPMAGKNVGLGNIPGEVHGVNYDWPVGRVAVPGWPDSDKGKGEHTITTVVWTAPRAMEVSVAGGVWMAGQYQCLLSARLASYCGSIELQRHLQLPTKSYFKMPWCRYGPRAMIPAIQRPSRRSSATRHRDSKPSL